ncbi:MAG: hypothetical protein KOO60_02735 [Gemmatimonadales bacterium]|nr:hypothetical protein [Gemmatimonadales bacterium]
MMEDRNNPGGYPGKHSDWNELALLVDEGLDAVDSATLEHLAGCAECQSAWAEAARYRGARVLDGPGYFVPEELAARAGSLIRSRALDGQREITAGSTSRRFWRPAPVFSVGGALLAAVLALFVLFPGLRGTDQSGAPKGPDDPRTLIHAVLESQSNWGMVFPGVTGSGDSGYPVYRSGDGADGSLQEALDQMNESLVEGWPDPNDTWWLAAGNLAAGNLGLAADLVHQALRRNPGHLQLLHLEAITAWQLSEFDRAEHALRRILALAPADSTALFNLALIQIDTGRENEADALLQGLAAGSTNVVLQQRARDVLGTGQQE